MNVLFILNSKESVQLSLILQKKFKMNGYADHQGEISNITSLNRVVHGPNLITDAMDGSDYTCRSDFGRVGQENIVE